MVHPNLLSGLGAVLSIFLSSVGASWASVPAGLWAIHNASSHHKKEGDGATNGSKKCMFRSCFFSFAPIIIAGVLAIYGTIVAVLITSKTSSTNPDDESIMMTAGYRSLTAGLVVGLACLASGGGMAHFIGQVQQAHGCMSSSCTNHIDPQIPEQQPLLASRHEGSDSTNSICNVRFLMVMVFLEAIALYGLIVALLILST